MLTFINVTAWALMLGLPLFGLRRGSGAILCVGIYVFLFSILIVVLAPTMATALPVLSGASHAVNLGWWQLLLFIPLFGLSFPLGMFLNRFLAHSFEPFEETAGLVIGMVVGFIAARAFLGAMTLCTTGTDLQVAVEQLFLVRQTVALDGFRGVEEWFTTLN